MLNVKQFFEKNPEGWIIVNPFVQEVYTSHDRVIYEAAEWVAYSPDEFPQYSISRLKNRNIRITLK